MLQNNLFNKWFCTGNNETHAMSVFFRMTHKRTIQNDPKDSKDIRWKMKKGTIFSNWGFPIRAIDALNICVHILTNSC